jgi:hypothetical protein
MLIAIAISTVLITAILKFESVEVKHSVSVKIKGIESLETPRA